MIETIYKNDKNFPSLLREISDPPEKLFLHGNISPLLDPQMKILCIVGSRKYSNYGKEVLERLIGELSGYKICIVSGLALGIDSIAHRVAISAGLYTIAFPGSGLDRDVIYPPSHRRLSEEIIESGGALLSEFEMDQIAQDWTFPQRNRLMAGIAHGTLLIEAGIKSGSMITVRRAIEYNRDIATIPGQIFDPLREGPLSLIRDGATPITSSDDLLEFLGFARREGQSRLSLKNNKIYDTLGEYEKKIISLLQVEPRNKDFLSRELGIDAREINTILSSLELEEFVKEDGGIVRSM